MRHPDKLTRAEAAAALGISAKTLASWERSGKIAPPERDHRGWRLYERKLILDMRRRLLGGDETDQPSLELPGMELSALNRIAGMIKEISGDGVMCEVVLAIADDSPLTVVVPRSSVRRLGLRVGDRVTAVINATDIMLAR